MTTLLNSLPALRGTTAVSLSGALGTPGDVLSTITIGAETMTVVSGIGTPDFIVNRGTPAAHAVGATVTYAAGTPLTGANVAVNVDPGSGTFAADLVTALIDAGLMEAS